MSGINSLVAAVNATVDLLADATTGTASGSGVTTIQVLKTYNVAAALLNTAGKTIRVHGAGTLDINTTTAPVFTLKLGASVLATWTVASITATIVGMVWNFDAELITVSTGAAGTVETHGTFTIKPTAGAGVATTYIDGNTGVSGAIDLTSALALTVNVTFNPNGASSTTNIATERQLTVELL